MKAISVNSEALYNSEDKTIVVFNEISIF